MEIDITYTSLYYTYTMTARSLLSWKDIMPKNPEDMNNQIIEARLTAMSDLIRAWAMETLGKEETNEFHARLLSCFVELVQKAPQYSWLLNTSTYKDMDSPTNPQFLDIIRTFKLKKTSTPKNHDRYIRWLKDILLIPEGRTISPETIELEANKEAQFAVQLIKNIDTGLGESGMDVITKENSRSPAFKGIHDEEITINELLHRCHTYLVEYHKAKKIQEKISDKESKEYKQQSRIMLDRNKSMFEIARVFAVIDTQLWIKQSHGKWTQIWDKLFLVTEMLELINDGAKKLNTEEILKQDNPFFEITETNKVFWQENNWSYTFGDENLWKEIRVESCVISGKVNTSGQKWEIEIRHVDFRWEKSVESSVLKKLRKDLESTHEILDDRGLRFVVDTKEDAIRLCSVLGYELWSWPHSWTSKPKLSSNENSWDNFKCLKGTLSVSHKRGQTKNLKLAIKNILPDDDRVDYLISDQWYQLGVEVQIFIGMGSYISAHHDQKSPAHHKNYKKDQMLEAWLIFYPPGIFPKTHQALAKLLAEKKKGKYLDQLTELKEGATKRVDFFTPWILEGEV
jgi:hypothetical protein